MKRRWLVALILAVACEDQRVIARVGKTRLRQADLDLWLATHPGGPREPEQALRALADRTLLAEGARSRNLQQRTDVEARIEAAQRDVLAQAILDEPAGATEEQALRSAYEAQKQRLTRRAVHVAHALFRYSQQSPKQREEARARAMRLSSRARAGENFAALARAQSEDPVTGPRGGDDGWLEEGQVDPLFFDRAVALKAGEASEPVETSYGFFVLKALEEPKMVVPPFEQVRGRLAAERRAAAESEVLAGLRERIKVELHPDRLRR